MSYETDDKMVSHPDHYKSGQYEVIDIIDEFTKDLSGTEAVCTANAIKYILRWKKKNGIQDVKKAIWYLQHMVDKEEERLQEEPTCSDCAFYEKGNCKFLNMHTMSDHDACGYLDPKTKENNAEFVNGLKKANEQLAEDFNKKVDMDKIMNPPTEEKKKKFTNNTGEELNIPEFLEQPADEEIHDCSDCKFRVNDPNVSPCMDCDLHPNPPTNWVARD